MISRDTPHRRPQVQPDCALAAPAHRWLLLAGCRRAALIVVALCLVGAGAPAEAAGPVTRVGVPWVWGWNLSGQLGTGTTADALAPVPLTELRDTVALAAGAVHSLALTAAGRVWAWGNNDFGQLGTGTTVERDHPIAVPGLQSIVAVAAGTFHSLALAADGTVWTWGMNDAGELGTGTSCTTATPLDCISTLPVRVRGLHGVTAIAGGASWSLALTRAGTVWAWGSNAGGQLGSGQVCARDSGTACQSTVPVQVAGLRQVAAIAAGAGHGLALTPGGEVWAWGENGSGQVGRALLTSGVCGTMLCAPRPLRVPGLGRIAAVAAGDNHSLALDTHGHVWTWGANGFGQLGVGTADDSSAPVQVAISVVVALAGGRQCSLALTARGTVWAWGRDLAGALAHTAHEGTTIPEQVPGLSAVAGLAQGSSASHSLVLVAPRRADRAAGLR